MATGGFKSNAATDFLEEWKAKREKMRAKMLGDIAAATGTPLSAANANNAMDFNSGGNTDRNAWPGNCQESSHPVAPVAPTPAQSASHEPGSHKKGPAQTDRSSPVSSGSVTRDDYEEKDSPPTSKGREKKSSGPSARKGKGQIEKRKLREKRRSTGVVSIPSNESLDELDDDELGEKGRREEVELVQANTCHNETMTVDPRTGHLMEISRPGPGHHRSSASPVAKNEVKRNNARHSRDEHSSVDSLEIRLEELEKELEKERLENANLLKALQEKDNLIGKLNEEIDLLNRDLDDIEDENDQLKQENKTLLKVVGQLTR